MTVTPLRFMVAFVLTMVCYVSHAADGQLNAISLSAVGCQNYAMWSGNLVWASDLGADKEKARTDLLSRDQKAPHSIFSLILRNLDALWDTSADWEQVTVLVMQDCILRQGIYAVQ